MTKDMLTTHTHEAEKMSAAEKTLAIIGLGNMGLALAQGLQTAKEFADCSVQLSNGNKERTAEKLHGLNLHDNIVIAKDNTEAIRGSHMIFFALKQKALREQMTLLRENGAFKNDQVIVSLAAGVTMDTIKRWAGNDNQPVVRVMPNTAASVGEGVFGWAVSDEVTVGDAKLLRSIFDAMGTGILVEGDEGIDMITALSGSGIAYMFEMGNQLERAAVSLGMNASEASRIAKQTLLGAAMKAMHEEDDFATLRQKVTSPNGTTEKALGIFSKYHFGIIIHEAVFAAKKRAEEIGKEFASQ